MEKERLRANNTRLVADSIDRFLASVVELAGKHFAGPYSSLKIAAATTLLAVLATFPHYRAITNYFDTITGRVLSWQVSHPLSPIPGELKNPTLHPPRWEIVCGRFGECEAVARGTRCSNQGCVSSTGEAEHADNVQLRLTRPVLGWLAGTGAWTVVVWNHAAGLATFYLLALLATEALDSVAAALFVLGLAPTFFGAWFFNDFVTGDGVAYFLILLTVAWRSPLLSALSFVAAAFCDERSIAAAPLLAGYIALRFKDPDQLAQRKRSYIALVSAIVLWALLRLWLAKAFGLSTGTSGILSTDILRYQLSESVPGPLLNVFRASWTLVAFAVLALVLRRHWRGAVLLTVASAAAIAPAFGVWDFSRSVAYGFVALLMSLYFLPPREAVSTKYLAAILVINTLLSAPGKSILRVLVTGP